MIIISPRTLLTLNSKPNTSYLWKQVRQKTGTTSCEAGEGEGVAGSCSCQMRYNDRRVHTCVCGSMHLPCAQVFYCSAPHSFVVFLTFTRQV